MNTPQIRPQITAHMRYTQEQLDAIWLWNYRIRQSKRAAQVSQKGIIEILDNIVDIDIECSICLNTHKKSNCVYITECKHIFCKADFHSWMKHNKSCPLCRTTCNQFIEYC
jgi:hypothetical protein